MAGIKIQITSNRKKDKNLSPGQAKSLGARICRALAKSQRIKLALLADIPPRAPGISGLRIHDNGMDTLIIQGDTVPGGTFQEGVEEILSSQNWLGDPSDDAFVKAVQDRLEGKDPKDPGKLLHKATKEVVRGSHSYKTRRSEVIKKSIGKALSLK